jgi:hypothetical protein
MVRSDRNEERDAQAKFDVPAVDADVFEHEA